MKQEKFLKEQKSGWQTGIKLYSFQFPFCSLYNCDKPSKYLISSHNYDESSYLWD